MLRGIRLSAGVGGILRIGGHIQLRSTLRLCYATGPAMVVTKVHMKAEIVEFCS